jgi:hypothetical protein
VPLRGRLRVLRKVIGARVARVLRSGETIGATADRVLPPRPATASGARCHSGEHLGGRPSHCTGNRRGFGASPQARRTSLRRARDHCGRGVQPHAGGSSRSASQGDDDRCVGQEDAGSEEGRRHRRGRRVHRGGPYQGEHRAHPGQGRGRTCADGRRRTGCRDPHQAGHEGGFVIRDDDEEDAPAQQVVTAGATADPVKDYLKQIGKVALLNAEQEVELAKRIEAGLFAEEKLNSARSST